jgi:Tfp pilus assembly protein PilX
VTQVKSSERERGSAMVLALIVLVGLGTLSGLTVVSVQSGITTTTNDRFHAIAVYAAESGGASAMEFLRGHMDNATGWTAYVTANNASPLIAMPGITGNDVAPGVTNNPFSTDIQAWYHVDIYNDRSDAGYATGSDTNKRVVIHVTGHGPNGATAIVEWDVTAGVGGASATPCGEYTQSQQSENGGGFNGCMGQVNSTDTKTTRPGG